MQRGAVVVSAFTTIFIKQRYHPIAVIPTYTTNYNYNNKDPSFSCPIIMTATTRSSSLRTTSSKAVVKSTATNNHNDTPTTTPTAKKDKTKKAPSKTSASKKGKQSKTSTTTDKKNREESLLVPIEGPWYRIFTKGDEEYDRYMATEWGFEKVKKISQWELGKIFTSFWIHT